VELKISIQFFSVIVVIVSCLYLQRGQMIGIWHEYSANSGIWSLDNWACASLFLYLVSCLVFKQKHERNTGRAPVVTHSRRNSKI